MLVNNVGACYNGLVINYEEGGGGGLQNGKIMGLKLVAPPTLKTG